MLVPIAIVLRLMFAIHMGAIAIVFVLRRLLLLVWFLCCIDRWAAEHMTFCGSINRAVVESSVLSNSVCVCV